MSEHIEKRSCKRFRIPGAEGKYKKKGLFHFKKQFLNAQYIYDISKGGLSFSCDDSLSKGQKLMMRIKAPDEVPVDLYSQVVRTGQWSGSSFNKVAIRFNIFGSHSGCNSLETLYTLRRWDEKYASEGSEA